MSRQVITTQPQQLGAVIRQARPLRANIVKLPELLRR